MTYQLQGHVRGHCGSCEVLVLDLGPSFLKKKKIITPIYLRP